MSNILRHIIVVWFLLNFYSVSVAQEVWSLEKCIAFADTSNLELQKRSVDLEIAEINQTQAKMNVLPSLNVGGTHGFNWGQSIDPFTNQFATDRVRTNNVYASSNWNIFSGLKNYYLKNESDLTYQRTQQQIEIQKRNLKMGIAAAYMQVVLNDYLIKAAQQQVEYAIRSKELVDEKYALEYVTRYDVLAMSSQLTLDSMKLIRAQNEKNYSLILLKQLLNKDEDIQIEIPQITNLEQSELNNEDWELTNSLEFKLGELNIDLEKNHLKKVKGSLLPTVAINGSLGSGYSGNNKIMVGSQFLPKPFNVQMEENFYQSAVLTVNVPIFNRGRVRSDIKLAEAQVEKSKLDREILYQQLVNQYEKIQNEIDNERLNSDAMKRALLAMNERFEAATEEYTSGSMNVQDYLDIRNQLFTTQGEYYTSLITLRFKEKIMEYLLE